MRWITHHLLQLNVAEIHVAFLIRSSVFVCAIEAVAGCEFAEFHYVARESARLVREDILDLAQLLVQIRRITRHRLVLLLVEHQVSVSANSI